MIRSTYDIWSAYRKKTSKTIIGIMSGTSLDGVDAALVRLTAREDGSIERIKLIDFVYIPYSNEVKNLLISLCSTEKEHTKLDRLVVVSYGISEWYAYAAEQLLKRQGMSSADVDVICMHGQTIWHEPSPRDFPTPTGRRPVRATLQIGEPAIVRERTGIPVIHNLRAADIAAGGEGAPLAPYLDALIFGSHECGRIVQNIGGIGNATVIPAGASADQVFAYDTGPGNMVMDALVREHTQGSVSCDEGGAIAARGKVSAALVDKFFAKDSYFVRKPPKSTGREVYGSAFAAAFRAEGERMGLSFEDILASATALTAHTIVKSYEDFVFPTCEIRQVIVSGGGAHNETLMSMIRQRLPSNCTLHKSEEFGIPVDAKEAIAFAVLGHESLMGRPGNLITATGASHPAILGNITL